jgi:hypothetical protein
MTTPTHIGRLGSWVLIGLLIAMSAGTATVAQAKPLTYVGVWAETAAQCRKRIPVEDFNSPVRFTVRGYDQFEQHCTFKSVRAIGNTWVIQARCFATGAAAFNDTATIWTAAKRLTVKWASERSRLNYLRCR